MICLRFVCSAPWVNRLTPKRGCGITASSAKSAVRIVDTWWQTETGAIMITPLPGATPTKPGSGTKPFPGIDADIMTRDGKSVGPNEGGYPVIKKPWPSMLRTIYGDDERYQQQYWSQIPGIYFAGDGARKDEDGYFWIMGRIDDVINVAGHRLGTRRSKARSYRTRPCAKRASSRSLTI
jgi:acetyl-CoA synthetase